MTDNNIYKKFSQILLFIKEQRNGLAVDNMKKWGLDYNMMYGVSVVELKRYAQSFEKDNELANKLWNENIRETKLFSFFLFDPNNLSSDDLDSICLKLTNNELVEHACMNLFVFSQFASQKVLEWAQSDNEMMRFAAFTLLVRIAMNKIIDSPEFFNQALHLLKTEADTENLLIRKALVNAAIRIARISNDYKTMVESWVADGIVDAGKNTKIVYENIKDELEYI